jgi:CubicO group peptidase (beta-lactamase class C family)
VSTSTALADLRQRAQQEVDAGRLPACQYALAKDGELIVQETFGAPEDARFTMFSTTKPVVASVVWQLVAEGLLDFDAPVASWWPGFAANGKQHVTLDHVLQHTCGFPNGSLDSAADHEARVAAMESWPLEWEPGTQFVYHQVSAHWVLAELIARVTGQDHRVALRERVLDPLGLDRLELGVPLRGQGDILPLTKTGDLPTPEEIRAVLGVDSLDLGDVVPVDLFVLDQPAVREAGVPGGGGVSDAASVALFYQALLHDPKGLRDPEILRDVTTNARNQHAGALGGIAMRSRGLELAGDADGRLFRVGNGVTSPRTFGHGGAAGQIAWADPESGLSFAFYTNGWDQHFIREFTRGVELSALATRCG